MGLAPSVGAERRGSHLSRSFLLTPAVLPAWRCQPDMVMLEPELPSLTIIPHPFRAPAGNPPGPEDPGLQLPSGLHTGISPH